MPAKTILLVDDEQSFLEPLADALEYEGFRVLKARAVDQALQILEKEPLDLITIDIMIDPGKSLADKMESQSAGLFLCETVSQKYPKLDAFSISVVNDPKIIRKIESLGIRFIRKGETPLRTVLNLLRSKLTGIAYSTENDHKYRRKKR